MQMKLPGTVYVLDYECAENQRLVCLSAGGRLYAEQVDGERVFESGFARVRDVIVAQGLLRHVVSAAGSWTEQYLLDREGLLTHVDGVEIHRDERYRIIGCGEWLYGYSGDGLSIVEGPRGTRRIARRSDGRPARINGRPIPYGAAGERADIATLPATYHRDEFGRVWTITAPDGCVLTTYLWDGFACLGRIDGPPGEPLAAVFSLDPSRTPVRIILRDRVIRVPRDAFGEGLIAHTGVPGLHCGAVYHGYVHYRSRVLDPCVGSYDRPDPFHGGPADPRRRHGYIGELPVEKARSGPYAVCQYDPISYVDPTGENVGMTLLLLLSDFTWSLQHNLAGWFGLDFTLNWWIDFFSIVLLPRFFEFEGFHSERTGRFGTRRGGVFSGDRVFTYQHQMFGNAAAFDDLRQTQLFDPRGRFEPTLYGSLLRADPDDAAAFLLQGNLDNQNIVPWQWSRAGGPAAAIAPGLPTAYFPSGGLHFDTVFRALLGPRDCTVTELRPSDDAPVVATVAQSTAFVDFTTAASGVAASDDVLLTDAGTAVDVKTVAAVTTQGSGSRVRFTDAVTTVANTGIRLRGLGAPEAAEPLGTVGPAGRLNVAGTSRNYTVNDALRLSQGGVVVGAALIRSLEAQLQIDGLLPAAPAGAFPLEVRTVVEGFGGNANLAGNSLTQAGSNPLPAVDTPIVLRGSGQARGAVVVANPDPTVRQLDRTAADLAPLGSNVTWNPVTSPTTIGQATAVDPGATLTYNPGAVRTAPTAGALLITGTNYRAVRAVSGVAYDAIVIGNAPLPGASANPYQVERFVTEAPDLTNGTLGTQTGLALPPGVTLPGIALQLRALNASNIAVGGLITNATLSGATATLAAPFPAAPNPSDLVVLRDTATNGLELAVVRTIQVTVQLDRAINVPGPDLRLVALRPSGFLYNATRNSDSELTVLPTANGAFDVQMPRFRTGEIVRVNGNLLYRVSSVNGTTLTLEDGSAVLPPNPLTVQRMVPVNPANPQTGTPWAGDSGTGGGNTFTFRVWAPNAAGAPLGSVAIASRDPNTPANNVTRPATIAATTRVQIIFTAAPSNVGANVSLNTPNFAGGVNTFYVPSFSQSGVDLTVSNVVPGAPPGGTTLLVAIPYETTNISARGQLTAGNVLCPNDPENWEFDRRQSLAEHELTHTCQSATWGPLYMGYLPLFVLEGASELFTDVELPEFSPFVNGEISAAEDRRRLRIPNFNNIDFSEGVRVQVASDRFTPRTITLGAAGQNNTFALPTDASLSTGPVNVRLQTGSNFWTGLRDVVYNTLHILTLGGVMNLVAGGVWGGLIFGIGKLWFFMSRRWFGGGQEFPATIADDKRTVTLTTPEGRLAVQGFNEIILRSSSGSGVREVDSMTGEALRLKQESEFTGEVRIVPYKSHDISDWHDYFNATVPDPARPASIQIEAKANGDTLTLHPFDRVTIAHGVATFRTNVTAVPSTGVAELEQAPTSTPLRIAKVDENDPIGSADSRHLTEMGVGWLRWFFDPYAQFQLRLHPDRNSWQDILARIARYAFSSHSWSAAIPGSLFFNNLFSQISGNGHQTPFEQEASSESGNVYSPLSMLRGSFSKNGAFATYNATVGDIGRFWHVPLHDFGSPRTPIVVIITNQRDTPGSHLRLLPRIMPLPNSNPAGPLSNADTNEPNTGVVPANPNPGRFVPDALTDKNTITAGNPDAATQTAPVSFAAADLAFIPTSAALNQTVGCYVSFTRPGTHRLTVQDGLLTNWQGRDAHQFQVQTLWFDVVVADVTVTAAGQGIATADPPPSFTMVLLQRAEISVAEIQNRQYALTVTRPGNILSTDGLALTAGTATGTETVELSRLYAFADAAFTDGVLSQHGIHLAGDLHIPIRIFTVTVPNTLPLRDGPEPASTVVTTRNPAQPGFLLVPVSADAPPSLAAVSYPGGPTPGIRDPQITSDSPMPSAAARTFLGAQGVIFHLPFDDPPEETADLTLTVTVRSGAHTAPLTATVQLIPHFRLQHAPGTFRVQRGTEIELTCEGGVIAGAADCTGDGITAMVIEGSSIRLIFRPDATPGFRTVTTVDNNDTTRRARRTIEVTA